MASCRLSPVVAAFWQIFLDRPKTSWSGVGAREPTSPRRSCAGARPRASLDDAVPLRAHGSRESIPLETRFSNNVAMLNGDTYLYRAICSAKFLPHSTPAVAPRAIGGRSNENDSMDSTLSPGDPRANVSGERLHPRLRRLHFHGRTVPCLCRLPRTSRIIALSKARIFPDFFGRFSLRGAAIEGEIATSNPGRWSTQGHDFPDPKIEPARSWN